MKPAHARQHQQCIMGKPSQQFTMATLVSTKIQLLQLLLVLIITHQKAFYSVHLLQFSSSNGILPKLLLPWQIFVMDKKLGVYKMFSKWSPRLELFDQKCSEN